jgi:23S rRNA (uracil-5-)-methyltransferase RumA
MVALCKYFGKCGGCTGQHVDYETQLENKKRMLFHTLKNKESDFSMDNIKVFSDNEYHYRNRMDMIFHNNGIGFRERGNWKKIIDIDKCVISNEKLNELIEEVRIFSTKVDKDENKKVDAFDIIKQTGTFRYAVIRTPQKDSSISFVLNSDSSKISEAQELIKEFSKQSSANNILVTFVPKKTDMSISEDFFVVKGNEMLHETYLGKKFQYHIQGFFQNNSVMAEKMHEYVNGLLKNYGEKTKDAHLLDLYGGVGTFGIINADLFRSVKIVEEFKGSIETAEVNIKNNDVKNAEAIAMDAKNLRKIENKLQDPLFVITDPPRSGMHPKTILQLKHLEPEVIIYISCNVKQLSKELPKFRNYKIKSAALFDLFPQTLHSEGIIELVKQKEV